MIRTRSGKGGRRADADVGGQVCGMPARGRHRSPFLARCSSALRTWPTASHTGRLARSQGCCATLPLGRTQHGQPAGRPTAKQPISAGLAAGAGAASGARACRARALWPGSPRLFDGSATSLSPSPLPRP